MASTPPLQLQPEPQTPSTPLHGSAYHKASWPQTRYLTRSSTRKIPETPQQLSGQKRRRQPSAKTPEVQSSPVSKTSSPHPSPQDTPKKKSSRRGHIVSPPSPGPELSATQTHHTMQEPQSNPRMYLSANTTMSEGMLPTPVKTPKKKTIPKASLAARALFQDQHETDDAILSPRKSRKTKRFNGFSLESAAATSDNNQDNIQIFTDSRDRVPQMDRSEENPFVDRPPANSQPSFSQRVQGTSKRRRVTGAREADPEVLDAIEKDEGMFYMFRGKKVFRRFDDTAEEDEELDTEDIGLLEHATDVTTGRPRTLRTLTRKSIRPMRLFETEEQKRVRELEQEAEEAETEIEESDRDAALPPVIEHETNTAGSSRQTRSGAARNVSIADKGKKASPFDSWPRTKAGSRLSGADKSKKRPAPDSVETLEEAVSDGRTT